jgi:glycosyltransferase involved in cell wall biosynthesis
MQDRQPYFSVIMPVYNKKPHLPRAIQSVLNQTFRDFELIAVDDASTDGSAEVLRAVTDPRLRIFQRETPGAAGYAARNLGIGNARAEWVAFLDADDEWFENHLAEAYALTREEQVDFGSCGFMTDTGTIHHAPKGRVLRGADGLKLIEGTNIICTNSVIVRRSLFDRAGLFPAGKFRRGGDGDTWLRLILQARAVAVSHVVTSIYHTAESGVISNKKNLDPVHPVALTIRDIFSGGAAISETQRKALKRISNRKTFLWALENKKNGNFSFAQLRALYLDALKRGDTKKLFIVFLPLPVFMSLLKLKAWLRARWRRFRNDRGFHPARRRPGAGYFDLCIVADCARGGDDPAQILAHVGRAGEKTIVIHCPVEDNLAAPVDAALRPVEALCFDYRDIERLRCETMSIMPRAQTSPVLSAFRKKIFIGDAGS